MVIIAIVLVVLLAVGGALLPCIDVVVRGFLTLVLIVAGGALAILLVGAGRVLPVCLIGCGSRGHRALALALIGGH